jgi:hypothetical protein
MDVLRAQGSNNDLAFDSQPIGWSVVGAALQNHCVGARDAYGPGNSYRSRSSAGQLRLVDCWDGCSSQRQHAGWLLCRNVISAFPGRLLGKQVLPLFSYFVSTKHDALAGASQRSHRRAHSSGKASLVVEIRPAEKIVGVVSLRASSSLTRTRDVSLEGGGLNPAAAASEGRSTQP